MGSSLITDCVCDNDNEFLDKVTESCEFCPENKIKGPISNGDADCICDVSKGWNRRKILKMIKGSCIRCGWDEENEKMKPGFVYKVTEVDGVKTGCVCGDGYVTVGEGDEMKCSQEKMFYYVFF